MSAFVKMVLGALFGNVAGGAATGVSRVVEWGAILAAVPLAWKWYEGHGDQVAVSFTWSQLLFVALLLLWAARVIHRAPPPGRDAP